jgi:hypothetical protein
MGLLSLGFVGMLVVLVTKSDFKPSSGHVDLLRVRVDDGSESCAWGRCRSSHGVAWNSISRGWFFDRVQGRCRSHSCHRFIIDDSITMLLLLILDVEHLHGLPWSVSRTRARQVDGRRSGQSVVGLLHDDLNDWFRLLQNDVLGVVMRMRLRRRVLVVVVGRSGVAVVFLVDAV